LEDEYKRKKNIDNKAQKKIDISCLRKKPKEKLSKGGKVCKNTYVHALHEKKKANK